MDLRKTIHILLPTLLLWVAGSVFYPLAAANRRPPLAIGYYDTDRLYDTIPAEFYNDTDYTPEGRYHWNTTRYARKIQNTAAAADSMALDILALWGVENEAVVRDLSEACRSEYTYLHRTLNTFDGRDFALLYHADKFAPRSVRTHHRTLVVVGTLYPDAHPDHGIEVCLLLCNDRRQTADRIKTLKEEFPRHHLIVMGELPEINPATLGLQDVLLSHEEKGRGNLWRKSGWKLRDRIWADPRIRILRSGIHARRYLFDSKQAKPRGTFAGNTYLGGYSRALPVFFVF